MRKAGKVRIKKISAASLPLYFVILPGIPYHRPLSPLQLFPSASALFYSFEEKLLGSGWFGALLAPGIMYSLGVGREAGEGYIEKLRILATGRY